MGEWSEPCCITGLPIDRGDEAVLIVPLRDVRYFLQDEFGSKHVRDRIEHVLRGHYDMCGTIEEHPDLHSRDLGWKGEWCIWIRAEVWDRVMEIYPEGERSELRREMERRDEDDARLLSLGRRVMPEIPVPESMTREKISIDDAIGIIAMIWFANTTGLSLAPRITLPQQLEPSHHELLCQMLREGIDGIAARLASLGD